jgi:hypothetical protein
MIRRLLILAAIAALFTIVTVVPASAISMNNPDGTVRVVLDIGVSSTGDSNPAHGPLCGVNGGPADCDRGVQYDNPGRPGGDAPDAFIPHPQNLLGINTGAWNAVFGPGGAANTNTPICGVNIVPIPEDEAINNCVQEPTP